MHHLAGLQIGQLEAMYQRSPKDEAVGEMLLRLYERMPMAARNQKNYLQLRKLYRATAEPVAEKGKFKEVYRLGLLLPFYEQLTDPNILKPNNWFVYDMYQGMLMAQEQLAAEQMPVELVSFDTQRDSAETARILTQPELKKLDILLGPIFPEGVGMANNFSIKNKLPIVDLGVVSSTEKLFYQNPVYSSRLTPSSVQVGQELANFTADSVKTNGAFIVYGNTESERATAEAYRQQYIKRGGTVKSFVPFDYGQEGFKLLLKTFNPLSTDTLGIAKFDGHAVAIIADEVAASNILSALQNLRTVAPVFAPGDWAEHKRISFEQLENVNVYLYEPRYVQFQQPDVVSFRRAYVNRFKEIPSTPAHIGFESVYLYGRLMHTYGTKWPEEVRKSTTALPGIIFPGYNFYNSYSNKVLPIIRLEQGNVIVGNLPAELKR